MCSSVWHHSRERFERGHFWTLQAPLCFALSGRPTVFVTFVDLLHNAKFDVGGLEGKKQQINRNESIFQNYQYM